jgi:hypothetical protein
MLDMLGLFELLSAAAILVWVIGPLARTQYEKDLLSKSRWDDDDGDNPPPDRADNPLPSHPHLRQAENRRGFML